MSRNLHNTDTLARSLDFGCILVAFAAASGIASLLSRVGLFRWPGLPAQLGWPTEYVILLIASLVLWAMVAAYAGVHRPARLESSHYSYWRLIRVLLLWLGSMAAAIFFLKLQSVSLAVQFEFLYSRLRVNCAPPVCRPHPNHPPGKERTQLAARDSNRPSG